MSYLVDLHNIHIFCLIQLVKYGTVPFADRNRTINHRSGGAIVEVQDVAVITIGITNTVLNIVDCQNQTSCINQGLT